MARLSIVLLAFASACSGDPEPLRLWEHPEMPPVEGRFIAERPWLTDLSTWWGQGCGPRQPATPPRMADFGVGNGRVFALSGYACPLNKLHSMVGPEYQQEPTLFFEDTWHEVATAGGASLEIGDGFIFRVRGTSILLTKESLPGAELLTATFAAPGGPDSPASRAMVRIVVLRNTGDAPLAGLELRVARPKSVGGPNRRALVILEPSREGGAPVPFPPLAPGEEARIDLAYVMSRGDEEHDAAVRSLRAAGASTLLEGARDEDRAWVARAAHLSSPDPRVDDLFEGMAITMRTQQAWRGGISPMSRYTLIWTRDTSGIVRYLLRAGLFEEAKRVLDYYFLATRRRGDVANAMPLDQDSEAGVPEPDWHAMTSTLTGREAAEAPNFIPLMLHWYGRASGDFSLFTTRYGVLHRALFGQQMNAEGLQPFTGDETYHVALSMSRGFDILEHNWAKCCVSAYSAMLFAAAAEVLAPHAATAGHADDARWLREKAALVRESALGRFFWDPAGYYAPFLWRSALTERPPPFEDVGTQPLWLGLDPPSDERALSNLRVTVERLATPDGYLQSALDPRYAHYLDTNVEKGVYTGMMPGYALYNFALTDHPLAEASFNTLGRSASPSGNYAEYQAFDDHSALQPIYFDGALGDFTARYRPWEGGINIEAGIVYLTGIEPDAANQAVSLAPHLPNGWPTMRWTGLRAGDARIDLEVEDDGEQRAVRVTPSSPLTIQLSVPLPASEVREVRAGDRVLSSTEWSVFSPFGETRVVLAPSAASPGDPLRVSVRYRRDAD